MRGEGMDDNVSVDMGLLTALTFGLPPEAADAAAAAAARFAKLRSAL